jgi:hypothetical protein
MAVRVVAAVIILTNAINAYNWFLELRAGYTSWINIIEIGVLLGLGVGIFLLNEAARAAYVLLSAIVLALTGIGLVMFLSHINHVYTSSAIANASLSKSELEKSIVNAQNNKTLTPTQRQEIIQTLQKQINNAPSSSGALKIKQYLSDGLLIVMAIFPLVFFTRPAIKEVFV